MPKRTRGGEVKTNAYQARSGTTVRRKRRYGRRLRAPPPTARYSVYRWQSTSDSYLGPGRLRLGTYSDTNTLSYCHPAVFMSLTNNVGGIINAGKGCYPGQGLCRLYQDIGLGRFHWWPENCQNYLGSSFDPTWKQEQVESVSNQSDVARKVYHDWTDIRLNLYGTFSVPITYNVYIIQFPMQLDPFTVAAGVRAPLDSELNNMWRDITRNLQGNSVNFNGRQDWPKDVRILRHDRVTLQPLTYSDQAAQLDTALAAHTPNVHEYRLFLNHGRYRDYKWSENADQNLTTGILGNSWDVDQPQDIMADVEWGKRVFMLVTCTSPDVLVSDTNLADTTTARTQGSFDINVRNKFRWQW